MHASLLLASITAPFSAWAHGAVSIPVPRTTGDLQLELCGVNVTKYFSSDAFGPIEDALDRVHTDYNCDAYLCRGYQYGDNTDKVNTYTAGQVVTFHVDLEAAHKPGWANVSVVDLASNKVIGDPVKTWAVWPDDISNGGDDVDFNITIPDTLASTCDAGGKCALQWYWWSGSNSQTYESCVDFYIAA